MPYQPKITPGQGLLLLIQHYQDDADKLRQLKILFLCGASNSQRCIELCDFLLSEPLLRDYDLVIDEESIHADPVRRYFETDLAYKTLKHQLPKLDYWRLRDYYKRSARLVNPKISAGKKKTINEVFKGECSEPVFKCKENLEISAYIKRLKEKTIFQDLTEEDREKIKWLIRIKYISMVNGWRQTQMPIDIYFTHSWYVDKGKRSHTTEQLSTGNQHFGLMKSYMPLARNDHALAPTPLTHVKATEYNRFNPDSEVIQACFRQLVHPFSNSISGLFLVQLRVLAKLSSEDPSFWLTCSPVNFIHFIRTSLSASLYYSGGHSLYEYASVLRLPEVQEAFPFLPELKHIDLAELFYYGNEAAFDAAIEATLTYDTLRRMKAAVHRELSQCKFGLFKSVSPVGVDEIHPPLQHPIGVKNF